MDATCNVQDSIHVFHLVHNMCPGFWVHIRLVQSFLYPFEKQKQSLSIFAQKPAMSELKKLTIFTLNNLIWTIVQKYPNDF